MDAWKRKELEADLSAYLDGELSSERAAEVDALLRESQDARDVLDELRAVSTALAELPRVRAPAELAEAVRMVVSRGRELSHTADADEGEKAAQENDPDASGARPRSMILLVFHAARMGGLMAACILFGVMFQAWMQPPAVTALAPSYDALLRGQHERARAEALTASGHDASMRGREPAFAYDGAVRPGAPSETGVSEPAIGRFRESGDPARKQFRPETPVARHVPASMMRVEVLPQSWGEYESARAMISSLETVYVRGEELDQLQNTDSQDVLSGASVGRRGMEAAAATSAPSVVNTVLTTEQPAVVLAALEQVSPQNVILSVRVADAARSFAQSGELASGLYYSFRDVELAKKSSADERLADKLVAKHVLQDAAIEGGRKAEAEPAAESEIVSKGDPAGAKNDRLVVGAPVDRSVAAPPSSADPERPAQNEVAASKPSELRTARAERLRAATGGGGGRGAAASRPSAPGAETGALPPTAAAPQRGLPAGQSALVMPQADEKEQLENKEEETVGRAAELGQTRQRAVLLDAAESEPGAFAFSSMWLRVMDLLSFGPLSFGQIGEDERMGLPAGAPAAQPAILEIILHPPPASAPVSP